MHVMEFLPQLLFAPHVEIVETPLPEMFLVCLSFRKAQRQLARRGFPLAVAQRRGNFLLQYLQGLGGIPSWWLAQQQMDVLRHDYVTDQPETVPDANLIENFHESVACSSRSEEGPPPVTTERDEMEIAPPVIALQRVAHRGKPAPSETKGCGTPLPNLQRFVPE